MAERQLVTMLMLHFGTPRDQEAREQLAAALPDGEVGEPDDVGVFDVTLEADDLEHALRRVWDAVAASGTDDHIVFLEHPDLPEHWRSQSGRLDIVVEDLGPPVAFTALDEGAPVYDRNLQRIGVVDGVIIDRDIFEGLIVHTRPLPGRHRFADIDQIAELHERGVILSVDRDELHEPPEKSTGRRDGRDKKVESPVGARLRRAWDWIARR